ncbi:MAG: choice-of-anchor tandem repeat GloVer-containing protein [Verrucomicrobiota bacterium]|jgi:uncharacterized repeat protein (TIGR03803 family)
MSASAKSFHPYRSDAVKLPFKFVIALLFIASASLVGAQSIQTIYSFNGASHPNGLTLGNDGNFYGTTEEGGSDNEGTVFQVTTNGALTTLVSFNVTNGAQPDAPLTLGNDGNFYGTTPYGENDDGGTFFKVTTNGTLITLASFNGINAEQPEGALTLGNDGNFYGTTEDGGVPRRLWNGFQSDVQRHVDHAGCIQCQWVKRRVSGSRSDAGK